jgi:hypothetical protein
LNCTAIEMLSPTPMFHSVFFLKHCSPWNSVCSIPNYKTLIHRFYYTLDMMYI